MALFKELISQVRFPIAEEAYRIEVLCTLIEEQLEDKQNKPFTERKHIKFGPIGEDESALKDTEEKWKKIAPTKLEILQHEAWRACNDIAMTYAKREHGAFVIEEGCYTFQNNHYYKQFLRETETVRDSFAKAKYKLENKQ